MIKDLLYTVSTAIGAVTATSVAASSAIVAASVRGQEAADGIIRAWARTLLVSAGVKVIAEGLHNLPAGTCVLVCNHQSHFDVPVVFANLDKHVRFVAKAELAKIPLFGQGMRATGNLIVDRRGGSKDRETMAGAVQAVRERVSLFFFAEGTRSDDGRLQPFKKGAFIMALEAGVPIVPLAVGGTRHILPKNVKWVKGGQTVSMVVGEPIPTTGKKVEDRDRLMATTRAAVEKLLERANALIDDSPAVPQ